jgi:CheY-like chemotaxis protein
MNARPTVLVVEDEPLVADVISTWLELGEFQVKLAHDGAEALTSIEREPPCAVVLDLHMPILNGRAVLERLRDRHIQVPVVVLSSDLGARDMAIGLGAVAFITKAFELPRLIAIVQEICSGRPMSGDQPSTKAA